MKTNTLVLAAALAAAVLTTGAFAQSPAAPAASAPDRIVYVPQLPAVTELINAAKAQGLAVSRIEQTADSVTVAYTAANGQTTTIAYRPISAVESGMGSVPQPATPAPGAPAATTTTVVYQTPAYYPYGYPYYSGWYWPPVAVGLNFGWGWHGGGWGGRR